MSIDEVAAAEARAKDLAELIGLHVTYEVRYLPESDSRVFFFHLQVHARAGVTEEVLREVADLEGAVEEIRTALLKGARRVLFPDDVDRDEMLRVAWGDAEMFSRVHGYNPTAREEWIADLRKRATEDGQ